MMNGVDVTPDASETIQPGPDSLTGYSILNADSLEDAVRAGPHEPDDYQRHRLRTRPHVSDCNSLVSGPSRRPAPLSRHQPAWIGQCLSGLGDSADDQREPGGELLVGAAVGSSAASRAKDDRGEPAGPEVVDGRHFTNSRGFTRMR
jgi:hypothetical protein